MQKVLATVCDKRFSDRQIKSLEAIIQQNYRAHISRNHIVVIWNLVSKKEPQAILLIECINGIDQDHKNNMIKYCTKDWTSITGQQENELFFRFTPMLSLHQLILDANEHLGCIRKFLRLSITSIQLPFYYLFKGYWLLKHTI